MFSQNNQYISNKYTLTVDRHMYFAVNMLGLDSQKFDHFGKVSNPFCFTCKKYIYLHIFTSSVCFIHLILFDSDRVHIDMSNANSIST